MSDNVNKPSHYAFSEIECIDYLRAIVPLRSFIDHCRMSAIAYITRSPHKGSEVEDIDKAINYLQRARNEAEKAIEAAESNCLVIPDSSSGKAIPIPHGWRELEPDETPLATDMDEWMGGWVVRSIDSGQPYKWHDRRNIRKIETLKPKPLAIPEGWRELEADEMPKVTDLYENEGVWRNRINDSSIEYARYEVRHIRKIETANPNEPQPLAIPEGWRELEIGEALSKNDLYCRNGKWNPYVESNPAGSDFPRYSKGIHYKHIRKIETANTSETPNSSIPDPGPGYRLLSKEPPEQVIRGDEFWQNFNSEWVESENFMHEGGPQVSELYYRRKIEPTQWIPKVGDKVRVVGGFMNPVGEVGIIKEFCQVVNGNFSILAHEGRCTLGWFKKDDVELIEAAS